MPTSIWKSLPCDPPLHTVAPCGVFVSTGDGDKGRSSVHLKYIDDKRTVYLCWCACACVSNFLIYMPIYIYARYTHQLHYQKYIYIENTEPGLIASVWK